MASGKTSKDFAMTDMTVVQEKVKAIATAHTDYAKASFEANKAYLERLTAVKAPDQAMQLITEHMKSSYETFMAEATKIGDLYKEFAKDAFQPLTSSFMPKASA